MFYFLVKSNFVKLETSHTVLLPPRVECLCLQTPKCTVTVFILEDFDSQTFSRLWTRVSPLFLRFKLGLYYTKYFCFVLYRNGLAYSRFFAWRGHKMTKKSNFIQIPNILLRLLQLFWAVGSVTRLGEILLLLTIKYNLWLKIVRVYLVFGKVLNSLWQNVIIVNGANVEQIIWSHWLSVVR